MIVTAGAGSRVISQQMHTVSQARMLRQHRSTPSLLEQRWLGFQEQELFPTSAKVDQRYGQQQTMLLADSMGEAFDREDVEMTVIARSAYTAARAAQDVLEGRINLQYENIILWMGAHAIFHVTFSALENDYRKLVDAIRVKNPGALVAVSTLIPKPRDNHHTQQLFQTYNDRLANVVRSYDAVMDKVSLIPSHSVFLDAKGDIVRPIIQNYHDGFHLNDNGVSLLLDFWKQQLAL